MDRDAAAIEFREVKRADLPSFEQVIVQGLGNLERSTGLDELSLGQFQSLHRPLVWVLFNLLRTLRRESIKVFVGVEQRRVLGTASVIMLRECGYVVGVATDSRARNRGIATKLLERIHLEVEKQGKSWAALDVESDNETAIRLYRKLRYEEVEEFGWHVGPVPSPAGVHAGGAYLVEGSQLDEVAAWVNSNLPASIAGPLPSTRNRLSHLEIAIRGPGMQVRTWRLGSRGGNQAVVRVIYLERVKTAFMLPLAFESAPTDQPLDLLFLPALDWVRSLGGARVVVAFPHNWEALAGVINSFKLPKVVSTKLMVRPSR